MRKNEYHLDNVLFLSSTYTVNRFLWLFFFALAMALCNIAVGALVLHDTLSRGNMASLSSLHPDFHLVETISSSVWKSEHRLHRLIELRWVWPAISLGFFAVFGFTSETRAQYQATYEDLASYIRLRKNNRYVPEFHEAQSRFDSIQPAPTTVSFRLTGLTSHLHLSVPHPKRLFQQPNRYHRT